MRRFVSCYDWLRVAQWGEGCGVAEPVADRDICTYFRPPCPLVTPAYLYRHLNR